MDTTFLISLAVVMWLLHILLGWRQLCLFNRVFQQMSAKGRVMIGRNQGRFRPKTIIVLCVSDENCVIDGFVMSGFSVFAKPQPLNSVLGLSLAEIQPEKIFPSHKSARLALESALLG